MTIKIATKIYLASTLLASVSLMVGLLGITSLGQYKHVVDEMQQVSAAALLGEQVNGLILSVVMDSRGIYMAGSPQESEKFAKPLLKSLDRLQLLLNEWQEAVPVGRRAAFAEAETATESFVRFRQELVRLSRESTLAEARSFGDNDANRQARSALNDSIKRLVTGNEREVTRLAALVDSDYDSKLRLLVLALGIGLSAGGLVAGFVVSRQVVQPLRRITATMHQLAAGDYSASIPYVTARDEIGTMAQAIEVFKNNGLEAERLRQSREEERARAGADRLASLQRMAEAIEQETRSSVDQVAALSVQLAGSAKDMSQSATVVEANSHTVADTAVQALGTAQAVAAAAEQLSASIHEISTQVNAATKITGRAVLASDEAQATIKKLSGAVSHIGDVAGLISDIAAQTNLLALNATIEAARAGEAGKGFAVVAGEVKNLANQTARATSEISAQLQEIRATTLEAVSAVQLINGAIAEVEGVSAAVAAAVEQQGAATQEIARNVSETSHAVSDVSTRIAHVSREAGASGTRAQQVGQIAEELASGIGALREVLVRIVRTSNGTVSG